MLNVLDFPLPARSQSHRRLRRRLVVVRSWHAFVGPVARDCRAAEQANTILTMRTCTKILGALDFAKDSGAIVEYRQASFFDAGLELNYHQVFCLRSRQKRGTALDDASCRIRFLNYLLILVSLPHPALGSKVKQPLCWDPVPAVGDRHQPNISEKPTYIFITTKKLSKKVFNGRLVNQGDGIIFPWLRVFFPRATVPLLAPRKHLIDEKVGRFPTEFTFRVRGDKAQPFCNPTCGLDLTAIFFQYSSTDGSSPLYCWLFHKHENNKYDSTCNFCDISNYLTS
jgi:hypothetical protein